VIVSRKVTLKSIITDDFKKRFAAQVKDMVSEVKVELDKIKNSEQQLMLKSGNMDYNQLMQVRGQIEKEKSSRETTIKELESRVDQVNKMNEGDVFNQGLLDGFVEIKVGDNLDTKIAGAEIVVKDGIVQSVAEG
jgi:hypothetical protein